MITRYISFLLLEGMSSVTLLQTFRMQFLRFGRSATITADFGSNYVGAKRGLEAEDNLDDEEIKRVTSALQSTGTRLIQRCPKTPWVQGAAEHSVALVKKVIPTKQGFNLFQ